MATMNVSLPDEMKEWAEAQTTNGNYANVSDYVRDLIRRDIKRTEGIARLQAEVDKGRAGPFRDFNAEQLLTEVKQHTKGALKNSDAA
ncbi:MAG: type II toxin-antitoxin system ParD family antitoxin [Devosia nanyangense]|uniref:Type II toxin-antitoxin system ParD family antitoxin n=1 Tax=Devosia nanyangense TaxID=1228055 RepID=A0A933NY28_9HYPH|nr:type II toxin-antitoxin system ParD family antitoxin [Devosia nanyangense]